MTFKLARSEELLERARQLIPGGVNSPVRAYLGVGGTPPFIVRGDGARVFDEDGNAYIDLVMAYGPLLLGHRPGAVQRALAEVIERAPRSGLRPKVRFDWRRRSSLSCPLLRWSVS